MECGVLHFTGNLVSGTQCLSYTADFIENQSISRTEGNINFKKYSYVPKKNQLVWEKAQALSITLGDVQPSAKNKQYIILSSATNFSKDVTLHLLNNINNNKFVDWENREEIITHVYLVSPITAADAMFRTGGFKCTCQEYLKEYDCIHALAMSIAKKKLSPYMSMEIPIGQKKKPGRPSKAVVGALNHQTTLPGKLKNIKERIEHQLNLMNNDENDVLITGNKLLH